MDVVYGLLSEAELELVLQVPQIEIEEQVVEVPVAKQVQVPMVNTASGTAEELSAGSTGKSSKKAVSLSRL